MKILLLGASAVIGIASSMLIATAQPAHAAPPDAGPVMTVRQHELYGALRKLWEDHITWTRLYIVSAMADLPDQGVTAQRLLKNQADLGNAIKPFYGDAAGNHLTSLLVDHILIAAGIIDAAKAGNMGQVGVLLDQWYANSDEIADFLSSANPTYWPQQMMRMMMREHLNMTLDEAVAQLVGDYALSVEKYDEIHVQALHMSDMLAAGIIKQFPGRFRPGP